MDKLEQFYTAIKQEMGVVLATSAGESVTMRIISPVFYEGCILFFTDKTSNKYRQLTANPHCCISAAGYFAEATARFCGQTMLPENEAYRSAYCEKFPGAFDEKIAFGGRFSDFVLLRLNRLTGWAFEKDTPTPSGVPTVPFELLLP